VQPSDPATAARCQRVPHPNATHGSRTERPDRRAHRSCNSLAMLLTRPRLCAPTGLAFFDALQRVEGIYTSCRQGHHKAWFGVFFPPRLHYFSRACIRGHSLDVLTGMSRVQDEAYHRLLDWVHDCCAAMAAPSSSPPGTGAGGGGEGGSAARREQLLCQAMMWLRRRTTLFRSSGARILGPKLA